MGVLLEVPIARLAEMPAKGAGGRGADVSASVGRSLFATSGDASRPISWLGGAAGRKQPQSLSIWPVTPCRAWIPGYTWTLLSLIVPWAVVFGMGMVSAGHWAGLRTALLQPTWSHRMRRVLTSAPKDVGTGQHTG